MDDRDLDETLEETFPASDPPANTVVIGAQIDPLAVLPPVIANPAEHRFELAVAGETAVLNYERTGKSIILVHTEVPPALRGRHLADVLAKAAIESAHAEGLQVIAVCPLVKAYLRKHPAKFAAPNPVS